jgi:hypothetical protein
VLAGGEVAGDWVSRSRSGLGTRGARPIRSSFLRPCPGTRLPERSSRGVQPSFMVFPEIPALRLSTRAPLLGFLCPYSVRGRESPRPAVGLTTSGPASPVLPGWCACGSHPAGYGAAPGFPNLSAACSSPVRPAIFRRVTLMGFSLQGFVPHAEASAARRRRCTLLTLFPRIARAPVLGGGVRGRAVRCLGCSAQRLWASSGSSSSRESVRVATTV